MVAELRRGRAIELSKTERNICVADDFKGSLEALYRRGFVDTKKVLVDGQEIQSIYITHSGKMFLEQHDSKKWGSAYNIM